MSSTHADLIAASVRGDAEEVKRLLAADDAALDINAPAEEGTALSIASKAGKFPSALHLPKI